jgi:hypothetical protein
VICCLLLQVRNLEYRPCHGLHDVSLPLAVQDPARSAALSRAPLREAPTPDWLGCDLPPSSMLPGVSRGWLTAAARGGPPLLLLNHHTPPER